MRPKEQIVAHNLRVLFQWPLNGQGAMRRGKALATIPAEQCFNGL